jgi:hypothetical protein
MLRSAHRLGLIAVALAVALALGASLAAQADPFMGTWVLNIDKSEFNASGGPAVRSRTLMISPKGDMITHSQETYRVGQDAVTKIVGDVKYDRKDYPVVGAAYEQVSFTRMGNTLTRKAKNRGMEVETATYTVSPDGKTLTIQTTGNNYGVMYGSTQVFEKKAAGTNE